MFMFRLKGHFLYLRPKQMILERALWKMSPDLLNLQEACQSIRLNLCKICWPYNPANKGTDLYLLLSDEIENWCLVSTS